VEEVGGEHRRCLGVQELPSGRVGAPVRCRGIFSAFRTRRMVDAPTPVAEFQQLALDPLVSPAMVLGGEPRDQRGDLDADRQPSRAVRIGPLAG
jgi:hypothetical protein